MTTITNKLFSEFPQVSTSRWEEKIVADLKGKDYEKVLVWRTQEGFSAKPYYRAEDLEGKDFLNAVPGEFPYVRGTKPANDWLIRQDITVSSLPEANKKALEVLGKGVNSLGFILEGCSNLTKADLAVLLQNVCLEAAEVNFVCGCSSCGLASVFADYVLSQSVDASKVQASVSCDPLSSWMLRGKMEDAGSAFSELASQVKAAAKLPGLRTVSVNGKFFGNSGSSIVQELAFSLSMGAEYLDRLTNMGLTADEAASAIKFNFSISNNYFLEIARLRAGRLLWAHITGAFQPASEYSSAMVAHCETGLFNKTVYDPYVNLLRTQTETMSAALGGANSITVQPFDAIFQSSSDFSERIARNQQILLKEESYIDKVADIAGGSYYIENLTASIAEQAWKLFLAVEEKGGFSASLHEGFVQKEVSDMAAKRSQNIALRRENLLGVNQFPNFTESIKTQINSSVFSEKDSSVAGAEIETLKLTRGGQRFEALRYKTDQFALTHKRPTAFMLTIGNLAMRKARAQFSCNFFAVAGFEVIDNNGFGSLEEGFAAARAIGAEIVTVCSSDEDYAEMTASLEALKGKDILVIAGNPACRAEMEAIGITNFIHVRSNLLDELTHYQSLILS